MSGNVRRPKLIGEYRTSQNHIGKNDSSHAITLIPPEPNKVMGLMDNLIQYMNENTTGYRPLVKTAIIHAQFETIHPFMEIFQYQPPAEECFWQYDGESIEECHRAFLEAPIFDGRTFWEVEQEMEWVDD